MQRPPGALRDGKKARKRRAVSWACAGLPAAWLWNTGPSEAAEQGRSRLPGPSLDNPRFVPAASAPVQPPPCPKSEAAGPAALLGGWQLCLGQCPRQAVGSSDDPSQDLGAGLTEAHPGPTTQRRPAWLPWPACGGRGCWPSLALGRAPLQGLPGGASPLSVRGLLAESKATPGTTHRCRRPFPSPESCSGPWQMLARWTLSTAGVSRRCNWPSGPHRGRAGGWGSKPLERQSQGLAPAEPPDGGHRIAPRGTRRL